MSAVFSECGTYRYRLDREGDLALVSSSPAVFVMLNPSTADAALDDATIRRCRRFATTWGCNGIVVVNLYALRSTNPIALWKHANPVGPANDAHLYDAALNAQQVICAWGVNARPDRVQQAVQLLHSAGAQLMCLGTTPAGAPLHPLYSR